MLSVVLSILVFGIKLGGYFQTHSQAILSDALESTVNVIASLVALLVLRYVAEPADRNHPYGHGKIEYFSSAFEGGLITFASLVISVEAIKALYFGSQLRNIGDGLISITVAGVINLALGYYLLSSARKHQSLALKASGQHVLSDVWSTVSVLVGLGLVKMTGWVWMDPLVALVVAAQLGYTGYGIVRAAISGLTDEMEPKTIEQIARAFERVKKVGLIDIHNVKVIRSGKFHHIDGHVVVPEFWTVTEAHEEVNFLERELFTHYGFDGEIALHLDPCQKHYCSRCAVEDCPLRLRDFSQRSTRFTVDHLISGPQKDFDTGSSGGLGEGGNRA